MARRGVGCVWLQRTVRLPAFSRGCHYITEEIRKAFPELAELSVGVAHLTIQHTSASICLNECWDKDVLLDAEMMLNRLVPEQGPKYRHSCEGPDDMPAHVKAALLGSSLSIPITDGAFALGTWQGLWLCEHRDRAGQRSIVVTLQGAEKKA